MHFSLMSQANSPSPAPVDKGKLPLVEANAISLADIKPTETGQTIEIRVYRKWVAKNVKTQVASNFCAILLDKQGNAIQANMDLKDTDHFDELLQLNNAYRISRFLCRRTKIWDRTLPNETTLVFGRYTSIIPISNTDFPEHHFNFIAYNEVNERANISGAPLIDYIGCIYRISNPIISGNAMASRRTRRIIDIQNLDGINLPFLIWGEMAEKFDINEYAKMQKPVIIALSSAWASKKYGDFINPIPALEIQRQPYGSDAEEQMRNRYTIEALLSVNPQHYEQIRFTTEATLLQIIAPNGWYYRKCSACNVKVAEDPAVSQCHNHGPQPIPNYGYCFKAIVDDGTATATITCFSPEAHTFVPDCNTIVNTIEDKDTYHVPLPLKQAEGHAYIFKYHFGKKAKPGNPNFTLDAVFKPVTEPLLALPSTEAVSSPPAEILEEPSSHSDQTAETTETTSSAKNNMQAVAEDSEAKNKTAKRGLFQEAQPQQKKPRQEN
ncbi:nucleic acid-binding, OB-fold protein [Tanacetum coccineum]